MSRWAFFNHNLLMAKVSVAYYAFFFLLKKLFFGYLFFGIFFQFYYVSAGPPSPATAALRLPAPVRPAPSPSVRTTPTRPGCEEMAFILEILFFKR